MIYVINHNTKYTYTSSASISYNRAHLRPRPCKRQRLLDHTPEINPKPVGKLNLHEDFFGNPVYYFSVQEAHSELNVSVQSRVELHPMDYIDPVDTTPWEAIPERMRHSESDDDLDAIQYSFESPYIPTLPILRQTALTWFPPETPVLKGALDLMHYVYTNFEYDPAATTLATPLEEVATNRRGVCQDFAQFQIGCLRSLGIPARYVSGYLHPGYADDGSELVGAQATHAWLSVYTVSHGWVDLDPTNNVIPCNDHITLAWGRDYDEVSPLRGVMLGGGNQFLDVYVSVALEPAV